MPANLTPEYERAERRYRQAATDQERQAALREMLSAIPKHKGTEKMQADLKRRLSQFRKEEQKPAHAKGPDPFHIPRGGAGQVVLVGPPNTGKSSLLAATTNAEAKVADYPFTTLVPQPGMWHKDDVQIELVDTPPVTADHVPAGLMGTLRNSDVVTVVAEAGAATLDQVELTLAVLKAHGLTLCSVPRHELPPADTSRRPGLVVVNKAELAAPEAVKDLMALYAPPAEHAFKVLAVSTHNRQGLDELFKALWELLGLIRVYTKEPGRPPDLHKPFTVPVGSTLADLARQIHRDLPERMRFARLWGHSRFDGQQIHKTEPLKDRDVVEIHE